MKLHQREKLIESGLKVEFLNQVILVEFHELENLALCTTCSSYILKKKIPTLCINTSNLKFPTVPDAVKQLTSLEERCVSPRNTIYENLPPRS